MSATIGVFALGLFWGIVLTVGYLEARDADVAYENQDRNPLIVPPLPATISTLRHVDTSEARKNAKRMYALAVQERVDLAVQMGLSVESQRLTPSGTYDFGEEAA